MVDLLRSEDGQCWAIDCQVFSFYLKAALLVVHANRENDRVELLGDGVTVKVRLPSEMLKKQAPMVGYSVLLPTYA